MAAAGAAIVGAAATIDRDGVTAAAAVAAGRSARYRSRPDLVPPTTSVTDPGGASDDAQGYVFVTPNGPTILDGRGEPVWIHPVPHASADLRVQTYRGEPVLTWWEGTVTKYGTGSGVGVVMDRRYRKLATIRAGNGLWADLHELTLTDRSTAYVTAVEQVEADLRTVGGPRRAPLLRSYVQEVDVATGEVLFEWNSADHIPLEETEQQYQAGKPFSSVHLNSVDVMADGNLLVSARNTWTLYNIDAGDGRILWRLGGKASDFVLGPDVAFAWQHDPRQQPDGSITLFDDEAGPAERPRSRGLVLSVDEATMRVTLHKAYVHRRPPLLATSQGSMQVLDGGGAFVGWGSEPYY